MSRPLQDSEAEAAILGCLLTDSSLLDRVDDKLSPGDFSVGTYRQIFTIIRELSQQSKPADHLTVLAQLAQGREVSDDLRILVTDLQLNTPTTANLEYYARIVRDHSIHRALLVAANEVSSAVIEAGGHSASELVDMAQQRFSAVADGSLVGAVARPIGDVLVTVVDALEKRLDGISGLPTGLTDLDAKLCGLHPGNLVIIAGRPAMGKTTLAMQIALNAAKRGDGAGVFSLEMGADELTERAISNQGRVSAHSLRSGQISSEGWDRISSAMGLLKDMPLYIDDFTGATVDSIRARARRMKRQHDIKLIVIDYLQLLIRGTGQNVNDEVSQISRGLKLLARELKIPVILLSQLNRKCEERSDKRPMLSDLRDSGAIEQDADVAIFVYRDEIYNKESRFKGVAELLIRKVRMGETGDVYSTFMGEFNAFGDIAQDWHKPEEDSVRAKKKMRGEDSENF